MSFSKIQKKSPLKLKMTLEDASHLSLLAGEPNISKEVRKKVEGRLSPTARRVAQAIEKLRHNGKGGHRIKSAAAEVARLYLQSAAENGKTVAALSSEPV
jgi:hypothetical protein